MRIVESLLSPHPVAAGVSPAVEPGILPGGASIERPLDFWGARSKAHAKPGRRDAALHVRRGRLTLL
jgi:hypothetical protein